MEKLGNEKCPAAWLLLQLDLVVFLLSRNLRKTCMVVLVPRASYQTMADDMAGGTTIEAEAIVTSMLSLRIS